MIDSLSTKEQAIIIKKRLIDNNESIFIDTDILKYYVEGSILEADKYFNLSNVHHLDLINAKKVINFIIKNKIKVSRNKMQEEEINKIILHSEDIKEKHYYKELQESIKYNKITDYTTEEKNLAKTFAPKSKNELMEQDFLIVICCNKDDTIALTTNNREHMKECLRIYNENKTLFNNIDKEIILLPLSKFDLIIDEINKGVLNK
jgi:hypothetical protein